MLRFDPEWLSQRLDAISPRSRTVFALTCSERLLPVYEAYCVRSGRNDWAYVRTASNRLWDQLSESFVRNEDGFLAEYPSLAPGDNTPRSERTPLDPLAENAVLALGSAWECHVHGGSQRALWAAEQAYEAMDYLAQNLEGIDYRTPEGEEALQQSDLVQNELRRQVENLLKLEQVAESDVNYVGLVRSLCEQAKIDGQALKVIAEAL